MQERRTSKAARDLEIGAMRDPLTWPLDPVASSVVFSTNDSHAVPLHGAFTRVRGELTLDRADGLASRFRGEIEIASLTAGERGAIARRLVALLQREGVQLIRFHGAIVEPLGRSLLRARVNAHVAQRRVELDMEVADLGRRVDVSGAGTSGATRRVTLRAVGILSRAAVCDRGTGSANVVMTLSAVQGDDPGGEGTTSTQ